MTIEETIAAAVAAEVRPLLEEIRAIRSELKRDVPTGDPLLTVEEVGALCGAVTPETVRGWIHAKKLCGRKVGNRFLVSKADLESFLAAGAVEIHEPIDSDAHLRLVMERIHRAGSK